MPADYWETYVVERSLTGQNAWTIVQSGPAASFPTTVINNQNWAYYIENGSVPPQGWDFRATLTSHEGRTHVEPIQNVTPSPSSNPGDANYVTKYDYENYYNTALVDKMVFDASGNLIVVGHFGQTVYIGGQTVNATAGQGIFIAKYSPTRQLLWVASPVPSVAGPILGVGDVAVDATQVYICGNWQGTIEFGTGPMLDTHGVEAQPATDGFVAAYSLATGAFQWVRRTAVNGQDKVQALSVVGGRLIATGYFLGQSDFGNGYVLNTVAHRDMYLWRLNPANGATVWAANYGGDYDDRGNVMCGVSSTHIVVSGIMWSSSVDFGGVTKARIGGGDMFLAKYDVSGSSGPSLVWVKTFGGTGSGAANVYLEPRGLVSNAAGEMAMVGGLLRGPAQIGAFTITTNFAGGTPTAGGAVMKFAADGTPLWAKGFGGGSPAAPDTPNGVAMDSLGNVYMASSWFEYVDFGSGFTLPEPSPRSIDPTIVKFHTTTGIAIWTRRFQSATNPTNLDFGICVLVSASTVYFGGGFTDTIAFGGQAGTLTSPSTASPVGFLLELTP